MAPKRLSKPRDGRADSSAQHESREDEASQNDLESSGEENRALQMARKMRKDAKKRLQERRARIKRSHEEAMRSIEEAMNSKFDDISRRMVQKYKLRMGKLHDIIRRRTAIEASMLATSKKVDDTFTLAEKAFSCALGGRLQSLKAHQSKVAA